VKMRQTADRIFEVDKTDSEQCLYIKIGSYTVYIDTSLLEVDGLIVDYYPKKDQNQ